MKVLDLFSGIGGFSLGLDKAGFETVAFCEIEEYPRTILKKHWPYVPIFEDVRKLNKEVLDNAGIESVDVICGGFPCQPFSVAGKQGGEEDDRHLWPEMFRLIKELKPSWVIGENVAGFISMALDDVLFDLESEGYETQSFVIPACAVGGIHRRDRVWIIAYSNRCADGKQYQHETRPQSNDSKRKIHDVANPKLRGRCSRSENSGRKTRDAINGRYGKNIGTLANANSQGLQRKPFSGSDGAVGAKPNDKQSVGRCATFRFRPIEPPTQPPVRHRDDGLPNNVARLKALGNAVVPQIPELIGRAILTATQNKGNKSNA